MVVVKVPKHAAEEVIERARKLSLLDRCREVVREGDFVLIPLTSPLPDVAEGVEVVDKCLPARRSSPRSVLDALKGRVPREMLDKVPRSYDIVGDVVVVNDMRLPRDFWGLFVEAIRGVHKNVRVVLVKVGGISGEERVGGYEIIYGDEGAETLHKEHGCVFKVDVRKAFYTPRLSGERLRIAKQVGEGEVVVDMFAGVGPFSIIIAKHKPGTRVYAVEKNPAAYNYLRENIRLNKMGGRVFPYMGDARKVLSTARFRRVASRVIMNLPAGAFEFLDTAIQVAGEDAVIHYYAFAEKGKREKTTEALRNKLLELTPEFKILTTRIIKEVSPSKDMLVYDILVMKKHNP